MNEFTHYIKTIYKGIKDSNEIVEIGAGQICRFSRQDVGPYANIIFLLSYYFCMAQVMHEDGFYKGPLRLSVILPVKAYGKFKEGDSEEIYHRIIWFLENFADPPNGAIISVYISSSYWNDGCFDTPWIANTLWHTKKQWDPEVGKKSNYITLQPHSERWQYNDRESPHRIKIQEQVEIVKEWASDNNIEIINVDYTSPINEVYNFMLGAKAHIGYLGATSYIPAICGTKTIYIGRRFNYLDIHRDIGKSGGRYSRDKINRIPGGTYERLPDHAIGFVSYPEYGHLIRYHQEWKRIVQDPIRYQIDIHADEYEITLPEALENL